MGMGMALAGAGQGCSRVKRTEDGDDNEQDSGDWIGTCHDILDRSLGIVLQLVDGDQEGDE